MFGLMRPSADAERRLQTAARGEARRLDDVPATGHVHTATIGDRCERFVHIADDIVAVDAGIEGALEQSFDCARRRIRPARHEAPSFDSRPSQSPSSTRREWRSARRPAAVTVK